MKVYVIKDGNTRKDGVYGTREIAASYVHTNETVHEEVVIEIPSDHVDLGVDIQTEADEAVLKHTTGERWVVTGGSPYVRVMYRTHPKAEQFVIQQRKNYAGWSGSLVRFVDGKESPLPPETRILTAQ